MAWTQTPASQRQAWIAVATSAHGMKLLAACKLFPDYAGSGTLITSDNFGTNWTSTTAPSNDWSCVACSANGVKMFAAASFARAQGDGKIYASADSGASWLATSAPSNNWRSICCSAGGSVVLALADSLGDGLIYASTNFGVTWTSCPAPSNNWASVACSADGSKLVAASEGFSSDGLIYTSTNSNAQWRATSAPPDGWLTVAASADGTRLMAYAPDGNVTSTNSGAIWIPNDPVPSIPWYSGNLAALALSADGNKAALALFPSTNSDAAVYTTRLPPQRRPVLNVAPIGSDVRISWLVPSSTFALQRNSELATTDWTDVTAVPSLNSTNLHYELTISTAPGQGFYRLEQR